MTRRTMWIGLLVVGLLAGGGYALYDMGLKRGASIGRETSGTRESAVAASPPANASAEAKSDRKALYWVDPMVPNTRFDKPGKSPFMNMQLVPVYADDAPKDGGIAIASQVQQNLGIRTAEVTRGSLATDVEAVGSVTWNERDVVAVPARAAGFVERLLVRAPLDPVVKGQALAELYVPEWVAAQEEFLSVRRIAAESKANDFASLVDGARQRMRLAGMTDAQIANVAQRGTVQARVTVAAPIAGVLAEIAVREGSAVSSGALIARINGLSTVWVNAQVSEAIVGGLRKGDAVEARVADGQRLEGKVGSVLPDLDPTTRTLKVRVEVPNIDGRLLPGMFATLRFKPATRGDMLVIPSEALIATGTRTVVMVANERNEFMPVEVERGIEADGQTEIRKGLEAGQRVVLSGQFLVDSEANLKGVEARQARPATPDPSPPPAAAATVYHGQGRVDAITDDQITLSHGPIPALQWPAMTMGFQATKQQVPDDVKVGDQVDFDFTRGPDGDVRVVRIARSKAGARP